MRYPAEQKAETHEKIVNAAAEAFRERGSEGEGIARLMKELGLTHGGFYRHFANKEDLYVQALTRGFQQMGECMTAAAKAAPPGRKLRAMIESYLSVEHLEETGQGCVLAALAPEIARQPAAVRKEINVAMKAYRDRLLPFMPGRNAVEKRRNFFILIPAMAGTVMMARAIADTEARKEILAAATRFYTETFAEREE